MFATRGEHPEIKWKRVTPKAEALFGGQIAAWRFMGCPLISQASRLCGAGVNPTDGVVQMKECTLCRTMRHMPATLCAVLLAGCASAPSAMPGDATTQVTAGLNQEIMLATTQSEYILRPSDVLTVTVFREPDLSLDRVPVSASGEIGFPLLGSMRVSGLTPSELERELEREYGSRYLRDARVNVNVAEYNSHRVTVEGAVKEPGMYEFTPGTRLSGGLALAKGADRIANISDIAVFRETPNGMQIAKFDLAAMRAGTMADPVIQPGDRIVVGTSSLSVYWQDLLRALPAFGLFTQL